MITTQQISNIIDTVKIGVEESSFGKIYLSNDVDITKKSVNTVSLGIFQNILAQVIKAELEKQDANK